MIFDACYVLNLINDNGSKRAEQTVGELNSVNLADEVRWWRNLPAAGDYKARHQAASMSHFGAVRSAKHLGYKNVLVLEDDVQFQHHQQISSILADLEGAEWDLFYLGCNVCGPLEIVTDHLARIRNPRAMHAYAVNACWFDGFLKLREGFLQQDKELDTILCTEVAQTVRAYIGIPMTAIQRPSYSSILGRWVNYNHLNAKYDGWMRRAKNE